MITEKSPEGGAYFDPNTRVIMIGADVLKNGNVTEAVALRSESLFGSEQTIAKLTRENRTLAENVDAYTGFEGDRVTNLSMNKETVKNAHKLLIEPAHIVFMRHLKATSLYHGLGGLPITLIGCITSISAPTRTTRSRCVPPLGSL